MPLLSSSAAASATNNALLAPVSRISRLCATCGRQKADRGTVRAGVRQPAERRHLHVHIRPLHVFAEGDPASVRDRCRAAPPMQSPPKAAPRKVRNPRPSPPDSVFHRDTPLNNRLPLPSIVQCGRRTDWKRLAPSVFAACLDCNLDKLTRGHYTRGNCRQLSSPNEPRRFVGGCRCPVQLLRLSPDCAK